MKEPWSSACINEIDPAFIAEAGSYAPQKRKYPYFRKVLMKWAIIAVGLAILLTVLLVWPPREYRLVKEDGQYVAYLDPKYGLPYGYGAVIDVNGPKSYYLIQRNSVKEMEQAFRHGSFTVQEFRKLGNSADSHGKIALFNLDALYQAVFPKDMQESHILFSPSVYYFCAEMEDNEMSAMLWMISEEAFQDYLSRNTEFENTVHIPADSPDANLAREDAISICRYDRLYRYYIITTEHTTYYVQEDYRNMETLSAVNVFAKTQDGECFKFTITECAHRPDVSWLAAFSVEPYQ